MCNMYVYCMCIYIYIWYYIIMYIPLYYHYIYIYIIFPTISHDKPVSNIQAGCFCLKVSLHLVEDRLRPLDTWDAEGFGNHGAMGYVTNNMISLASEMEIPSHMQFKWGNLWSTMGTNVQTNCGWDPKMFILPPSTTPPLDGKRKTSPESHNSSSISRFWLLVVFMHWSIFPYNPFCLTIVPLFVELWFIISFVFCLTPASLWLVS